MKTWYHGRSHRDQPLERYLRPATPGPARWHRHFGKSARAPARAQAAPCHFSRHPDRSLLEDLVEIDEATPYRFRTVKAYDRRRVFVADPQGKMQDCRRERAIASRASHVASGWQPIGDFSVAQPSCLRCRDLGAGRAGNHPAVIAACPNVVIAQGRRSTLAHLVLKAIVCSRT